MLSTSNQKQLESVNNGKIWDNDGARQLKLTEQTTEKCLYDHSLSGRGLVVLTESEFGTIKWVIYTPVIGTAATWQWG